MEKLREKEENRLNTYEKGNDDVRYHTEDKHVNMWIYILQ